MSLAHAVLDRDPSQGTQLAGVAGPGPEGRTKPVGPFQLVPELQSLSKWETASFGPFELQPHERRLTRDGNPVELGGRAFDILCLLVRHAGEIVTKSDLFAAIWKGMIVEECSLRFHVSELRRALAHGNRTVAYVKTLVGQGYCFVAPVSRAPHRAIVVVQRKAGEPRQQAPSPLARMVGRDDTVEVVSGRLLRKRFVTLVGPGGIGKTTVAVAAFHKLAARFEGPTCFLDLGTLDDQIPVHEAVASALGVEVQSDDPIDDIVDFLRDKKLLLLLDRCEPVIEAAGVLAERIIQSALGVLLLATSREAMRVEGEHVIQLPSLESPPRQVELSAEEILGFPAVQLFIERVVASGREFAFNEASAPAVAEICRRLDGMPLALELAAGRVNAFGVQGTADLLDHPLDSLHQGRRTAPARHQSLAATLDGSYETLPETERALFRRLSVFAGEFTLSAAHTILAEQAEQSNELALASLVAKSLVVADTGGPVARYRMLDMTRTYGRRKLAESGEGTRSCAIRTLSSGTTHNSTSNRVNEQGVLIA